MGRPCMTCSLPPAVRREVDKLLVQNTPLTKIAEQHPEVSSVDSLRRHRERCLHGNLIRAAEKRGEDYLDILWDQFERMREQFDQNTDLLNRLIPKLEKKKRYGHLVNAIKESRASMESTFKMLACLVQAQVPPEDERARLIPLDGEYLEVLKELPKEELELLAKVSRKIAEKTGNVSNRPIFEAEYEEVLPEASEEEVVQENNSGQMVRTTTPGSSSQEIGQENSPDMDTPPSTITEIQGPVDPRKQRPHVPSSFIHFESGQAFTGHLRGGRRKRKRRKR